MNFDIHIAKTEAELTELYQLRYKVYVEELGRTQKYANHELKEVREPLDDTAHNMIAVAEGKIAGVMRFHFCDGINDSFYREVYRLNLFADFYPARVSYTTKLIVTNEYRQKSVALDLAVACYKLGVSKVCFNVIDCYPVMVPFFLKLGWRFYTENVIHPEFGEVIPMVLVKDINYLTKIHSPFAAYSASNSEYDIRCVSFFNESFGIIHQQRLQLFNDKCFPQNLIAHP